MFKSTNLVRTFQATIRHNGPRPAILDADRNYSWAEFGSRVARLAGALLSLGIKSEARFAILSCNGFRVEELKWAAFWIGAVPVPINWRLAPPEIALILADSNCVQIFAEERFEKAFEHTALVAWRTQLTVFGEATGANALPYEDMLARSPPISPADPDPDADAILLYTGGTTGRSKGVRLSHVNILSNAFAFGLGVGARPEHVYLHAAPMFHSADLLAMGWFIQGAPQCYLPMFSPPKFLEAIERHRVNAIVTVPTMLIGTVLDPSFQAADISSLRILIYGAAPMAVEWIFRVSQAFPHAALFNCYGLTETSPDLTIFDAAEFRAAIECARQSGDHTGSLTSVGKPNALNELRVVAPDGRELGPGQTGELIARGPNIMTGYLNLAEETLAVLRDGWLRTGDVARIDEAGYVYLLDRIKDLVITGGENVYSSEVEAVLFRHPAVADAAIIGVPDERLGEAVMAVIALRPGVQASEEELALHCRNSLGGFKVPRRFAFVEGLPKSALGKILKGVLRQKFAPS
jgi:long-chain acyl-CoA synthetase